MKRTMLILLIIAMLPLAVFAQEEINSAYLSDAAKEKLGIEDANGTINTTEETATITITDNETEPSELPSAGTTRDSPFYALDRAIEVLMLKITSDDLEKAKLHLKYASERLSEAKKLAEQNKLKLSEETISDYEEELSSTEEEITLAEQKGKQVEDVVSLVNEMTSKHIAVLQNVFEKVPDTAKPTIRKAIEVSQKGKDFATNTLKEVKKQKQTMEQEIEQEQKLEEKTEKEKNTSNEEENNSEEAIEETPKSEKKTESVSSTKGKGWH